VSSVRQAPRVAEKGEDGQALQAQLELKMIADVGLVGMPNAGKSTLLSVTSNATPEIANYPFTTLKPNLGVVKVDKESSLLVADIPGLIEGAAEGKGLGDEFLRHVERTAVLMHMIDAYQPDIAEAYQTIQQELKAYKIDLSNKPQVVVLTKIEALDQDIIDDLLAQLKKVIPEGTPLFAISAQTHKGLTELLQSTNILVKAERARVAELEEDTNGGPAQGLPVIKLHDESLAWEVKQMGEGRFVVTGRKIEKFAARTDFGDEHGLQRIRDIMKKMGIMHALIRKGINAGDTIQIATFGGFEY
jgi:GTP-binding protein